MYQGQGAPVRVGVCDDQPRDLREIESMTKAVLAREGIGCELALYPSGAALLAAVRAGAGFQILLLDVVMEGLDGLALAAALREAGDETAIIFISSNRELAMQGYEVAALRYLAKPLREDKLREALLFCCRTRLGQKEILLPTPEGQRRIPLSDLLYGETWERGVRLTLAQGECRANVKISQLAALLPPRQFVFCHRTLLINLAHVQSIRYCELTLKNGTPLPVSKYRQGEIKEKLLVYLRG